MLILDPNEIKDTKKETLVQGQRLVNAISSEEARINKSLNILRAEAKIETEKIKDETNAFIQEQKNRVETSTREVVSLESRRTEALKPIQAIKDEAETYLIEAKQAIGEAKALEEQAKVSRAEIIDLAEDLKDREAEISDRDRKTTAREEKATIEEKQARLGTIAVSDKWVEFYKAVHTVNVALADRELKITDREKILEIRTEKQDEREIEQNNHDRAIKDKYETLERTIAELKNKNII